MGLENGATKRMWLERWNKVGEYILSCMTQSSERPRSGVIHFFLTCIFESIRFLLSPITGLVKYARRGRYGDAVSCIFGGVVMYGILFWAIIAGYLFSLSLKIATVEEISAARSKNWCTKDYIPKILDQRINVAKSQKPLTMDDILKATKQCDEIVRNVQQVEEQKKAMK